MSFRFIKSSEKKEILSKLDEELGIKRLNYLLIESSNEKIRGFSGTLSREEIIKLSELTNIEGIGAYLIKIEENRLWRLSHDATQLLKNDIKKNIISVNDEEAEKWLKGENIRVENMEGIVVVQNRGINIGCGIAKSNIILNHVPKERRLREGAVTSNKTNII